MRGESKGKERLNESAFALYACHTGTQKQDIKMRKLMMVFGALPLFLLGCPFFGEVGDDPCAVDPSMCDSGDDGFKLNPECIPSGPLAVTLGRGADTFIPMETTEELEVIHGSQGGTHTYFAVRVGGVDAEMSPRLLVTLEMTTDYGEGYCNEVVPKSSTGTEYLVVTSLEVDDDYEPISEPVFQAQNGCKVQGCESDETCHEGLGCFPSVCFEDGPLFHSGEPSYGCAQDCAGGVCQPAGTMVSEVGCETRECGNDGAGKLCGRCDSGQVCSLEGSCEASCPNEDGCGEFCTPCPGGTSCHEGWCMVSDLEATECGSITQVRQLVLGKARPYKVNAEGQVEEAGITQKYRGVCGMNDVLSAW